MDADVKIQQLCIEIKNSDSAGYKNDEQYLSKLIQDSTSLAFAELLNDNNVSNQNIPIEKLELDLGVIRKPYNKNEIINSIKAKLSSVLKNKITLSDKKDYDVSDQERNEANISDRETEILFFFLRSGHLPWYATSLPGQELLKKDKFIEELRNFFSRSRDEKAIVRFIGHYGIKNVLVLAGRWVSPSRLNFIEKISEVILKLDNSKNEVQLKLAKAFVKDIVFDLVVNPEQIRSLEELIKVHLPNEIYSGIKPEKIKFEENSSQDIYDSLTNLLTENNLSKPKILTNDRKGILDHFLLHGSLPDYANEFSAGQFVKFMIGIFMQFSEKERRVVLNNSQKQHNLFNWFVELEVNDLKFVIEELNKKAILKESKRADLLKEISTSVLTSNERKNEVAKLLVAELSGKDFGRIEVDDAKDEKISPRIESNNVDRDAVTPSEEVNREIDAVYIGDLIVYLIINNSWPWWGDRYLKWNDNFEKGIATNEIIDRLLERYNSDYPGRIRNLSYSILSLGARPSVILSKLNWPSVQRIIDAVLPMDRNSFSSTTEKLLQLASSGLKLNLIPDIAAKQFIFRIADNKTYQNTKEYELLNDLLTELAVRSGIPLWKLLNFFSESKTDELFTFPVSQQDLECVFKYDREKEEDFLKIKTNNTSGKSKTILSESDYISEYDEKKIIDFINGSNNELNKFPSSWSLGEFILRRINASSEFRDILRRFISGNDHGKIQRLFWLEKTGGKAFIQDLTGKNENLSLQTALFETLKSLIQESDLQLSDAIRSALIIETVWDKDEISTSKWNAILDHLALQYQLNKDILRLHVLNELNKPSILHQSDIKNEITHVKEFRVLDLVSHVSNVKSEITIARRLDDMIYAHDIPKLRIMLQDLNVINTTEQFREWIQIYAGTEAPQIISELNTLEKIEESVGDFRILLGEKIENVIKVLEQLSSEIKPLYDKVVLLQSVNEKKKLLRFIVTGDLTKVELLNLLNASENLTEKDELIDLIQNKYAEIRKMNRVVPIQQLKYPDLKWWKDKLEFEGGDKFEQIIERTLVGGKTIKEKPSDKFTFLEKVNVQENDFRKDEAKDEKKLERKSGINDAVNKTNNLNEEDRKGDKNKIVETNDLNERQNVIIVNEKPNEINFTEGIEKESKLSPGEDVELGPIDEFLREENSATKLSEDAKENQTINHIIDVAMYFFTHLSMPWWSDFKDINEFERRLRALTPSQKNDLKLQLAGLNNEYFRNLATVLNNELLDKREALMSKEELENVLRNDLKFLSHFLEKNPQFSGIEALIRNMISDFVSLRKDEAIVRSTFRRNIITAFVNLYPEISKVFEGYKESSRSDIANIYSLLSVEIGKVQRVKEQQEQKPKNYLLALEKLLSKRKDDQFISSIETLLTIYQRNENQSVRDFLVTWLKMVESVPGISYSQLKSELKKEQKIKEAAEADFIHSELINILNEKESPDNIFIPFANYLNVARLISERITSIDNSKIRTAIELLGKMLVSDKNLVNIKLSFNAFFQSLILSGVNESELESAIEDSLVTVKQNTDEVSGTSEKKSDVELNLEKSFIDIKQESETEKDKEKQKRKEYNKDLMEVLSVFKKVLLKEYDVNEYAVELSMESEVHRNKEKRDSVETVLNILNENVNVLSLLNDKNESVKRKLTDRIDPAKVKKEKTEEIDLNSRIYIPNAGLVMLWPFLSRLFNNLNYTEKGQFIDEEKRIRAIYLSQYLIGFTENDPEYTLMLNKLLCGKDINDTIEDVVILTEKEKKEAHSLISSVLAQWKEMNNTSVENFQRTFLQREGVMFKTEENWNIIVGKSTFDVLLMRLPWGISIIKYPWNKYLIFVEWKAMS